MANLLGSGALTDKHVDVSGRVLMVEFKVQFCVLGLHVG